MRARRVNQIYAATAVIAAVLGLILCEAVFPGEASVQTAQIPETETVTVTAAETTAVTTTTTTSTTITTTTTAAATTVTTTVTTAASTTAFTDITIGEIPVSTDTGTTAKHSTEPDSHGLTEQDYAFLSDTVFVGDSICSGLRVYKILPDDNVVAKGCVGARNIFDYTFPVRGNEFGVSYSLSLLKPKYVVFSMGMNDVNMTTPEQFCKNYDFLLKTVHTLLPDSKLFVASVTPIAADCEFSTNAKIDALNAAISEHLEDTDYTYVDIASALKIWDGSLRAGYSGGDGIHLAPDAYYVLLNQLCDELVDTKIVGGWKNGVAYGWAKKKEN